MDKQEIIDEARRLGTFPISILPDEDCCSLFTPRHPATRTNAADVERLESALDVPALVATSCGTGGGPARHGVRLLAAASPCGWPGAEMTIQVR